MSAVRDLCHLVVYCSVVYCSASVARLGWVRQENWEVLYNFLVT